MTLRHVVGWPLAVLLHMLMNAGGEKFLQKTGGYAKIEAGSRTGHVKYGDGPLSVAEGKLNLFPEDEG